MLDHEHGHVVDTFGTPKSKADQTYRRMVFIYFDDLYLVLHKTECTMCIVGVYTRTNGYDFPLERTFISESRCCHRYIGLVNITYPI